MNKPVEAVNGIQARADGVRIAYAQLPGRGPTVAFFPGFASNMSGLKAQWLEAFCRERGLGYLRFDYQGHGTSSGRFEDGSIDAWSNDAVQLLQEVTRGPLLLVGSSMGAWMALIAARELRERVCAMVCVAPAPDFTQGLLPGRLTPAQRDELATRGVIHVPSQYSVEPLAITRKLIESGAAHTVLDRPYRLDCPLRILHGLADEDVPGQLAQRLLDHVETADARLTLLKHGDHRLSGPEQLALIGAAVDELLVAIEPAPG